MTKTSGEKSNTSEIDTVYEYHDRTKHHLNHYARSLGYLDWDSQPDPFRRYDQSFTLSLKHPNITETPTYDSLFEEWKEPVTQINRDSISHLFYESLAISAWKQAGGNRWSLRVNPSSGDLHPTEAYLIAGPIEDLSDTPAIYHYSPYAHALERRTTLTNKEWDDINQNLPPCSLLISLTSIYWRESWKYGERAFRYCHHDVGHAIGCITFAAAVLGWKTRLIHSVSDNDLAILLGLDQQEGIEAEHPDCLLVINPADKNNTIKELAINLPAALFDRIKNIRFEGLPNTLSNHHHDWPIIDMISEACRFYSYKSLIKKQIPFDNYDIETEFGKDRQISARSIIRQRRSALAMDGQSTISKETFYRMMTHVSPHSCKNIMDVLPWQACISLAIFIHRVVDLPAGLYLLIRDREHEPSLRDALRPEFSWEKPEACPDYLYLYMLQYANALDAARTISCHQNIAADGTFALGMLAEFDTGLEQHGASFYPRMFWETGLIGQILYLEAEAAGIRSTGIGCFFDDAMHDVLGIHDHSWQSLYHFTVGGPVEDPRLQTLPSYWYLK